MAAPDWSAILAGLSPHRPVELDPPMPQDVPASRLHARCRPPSVALFPLSEERAGLGIHVKQPLENPAALAARLAAIALERELMPVILSEVPRTGLERWGFRVERVVGATEDDRASMIEDLKAFWSIAVVIDAAEIPLLR